MEESFISIIDDDEDDVAVLKHCFEKYHSIPVKSYSSAKEFLSNPVNGRLPSLLVIDLNIRGVHGIDLINQIRTNSVLADVPIIVYTTYYSPREEVSCDNLKIRLLKKPDSIAQWGTVASIMAQTLR